MKETAKRALAAILTVGAVLFSVIVTLPLYNSVGFSWTCRLVGIQITTIGALITPVKVILREKDDRTYAKISIVIIAIGFLLQSLGNLTAIPFR